MLCHGAGRAAQRPRGNRFNKTVVGGLERAVGGEVHNAPLYLLSNHPIGSRLREQHSRDEPGAKRRADIRGACLRESLYRGIGLRIYERIDVVKLLPESCKKLPHSRFLILANGVGTADRRFPQLCRNFFQLLFRFVAQRQREAVLRKPESDRSSQRAPPRP